MVADGQDPVPVGADPGRWTLMRTATSQPQPADLVPPAITGTVESMLVSAYRPSFVSRVRPSTLAKIASCATRGNTQPDCRDGYPSVGLMILAAQVVPVLGAPRTHGGIGLGEVRPGPDGVGPGEFVV